MRLRIIDAAVDTVAAEGPDVSTAVMAKRGGIAQGSIFHHFQTKTGLLNAVYLHLKEELRAAVLDDLPDGDVRDQLRAVWIRWMDWGTADPVRRRALHLLNGSPMVTEESRAQSIKGQVAGLALVERASAGGALAGHPLHFIDGILEGLAAATLESIDRDPEHVAEYRGVGFDALWNMMR